MVFLRFLIVFTLLYFPMVCVCLLFVGTPKGLVAFGALFAFIQIYLGFSILIQLVRWMKSSDSSVDFSQTFRWALSNPSVRVFVLPQSEEFLFFMPRPLFHIVPWVFVSRPIFLDLSESASKTLIRDAYQQSGVFENFRLWMEIHYDWIYKHCTGVLTKRDRLKFLRLVYAWIGFSLCYCIKRIADRTVPKQWVKPKRLFSHPLNQILSLSHESEYEKLLWNFLKLT